MTPRSTTTTTPKKSAPPKKSSAPKAGSSTFDAAAVVNAAAGGQDVQGAATVSFTGFDPGVGGATFLWDQGPGAVLGAKPKPVTINQAVAQLYQMDDATRANLAQRLYAAGLYDDGYYGAKGPRPDFSGTVDDGLVKAFRNGVVSAVRYQQAGVDMNTMLSKLSASPETLKKMADASGLGAGQRQGRVGGGAAYGIELTNPASVRKLANDLGSELLGRKLTADELARVESRIHGEERRQQGTKNRASEAQNRRQFAAAAAAEGGTDQFVAPTETTTFDTNPTALAEDQIRRDNPVEVGAHDVANTFGAFLQLVTGGAR